MPAPVFAGDPLGPSAVGGLLPQQSFTIWISDVPVLGGDVLGVKRNDLQRNERAQDALIEFGQGNEQAPPSPLSEQGRKVLEDRCQAVITECLDWVDRPHRVRENRLAFRRITAEVTGIYDGPGGDLGREAPSLREIVVEFSPIGFASRMTGRPEMIAISAEAASA